MKQRLLVVGPMLCSAKSVARYAAIIPVHQYDGAEDTEDYKQKYDAPAKRRRG